MGNLSIVLAIIFGTFTVAGAIIGATWKLSGKIADLQVSVAIANGKIEGLQLIVSSLQSRIIHLEARLDAAKD